MVEGEIGRRPNPNPPPMWSRKVWKVALEAPSTLYNWKSWEIEGWKNRHWDRLKPKAR